MSSDDKNQKRIDAINKAINNYRKQIDRISKIANLYKGTKVETELQKTIEKYNTYIKNLEDFIETISKKKPEDETKVFTAETALKESLSPKETQTKSFTVDAILTDKTTTDEIETKVEEEIEKSASDVYKLLEATRQENKKLHDNASKNTTKSLIIGVVVGGIVGFIASYSVAILTAPVLPKILFTNGTAIFP